MFSLVSIGLDELGRRGEPVARHRHTDTYIHQPTNPTIPTLLPPIPTDHPPAKTNPKTTGAYYLEASGPESGKALLSAAVADDQRFAFSQAFQALEAFGM